MSNQEITAVFCYDVVRSKTRRRVASFLEDHLVRVQRSVFEARIKEKHAEIIFAKVATMLDEDDTLRMYVLGRTGLAKSRAVGGAPLPEEASFWLL